eukprot:TRINITY_DN5247_c0_g2_i1.p1 TRINITY_DN5247_c0_g2~~TRINITY_DN5247_c0_g2_i1.p1  ORF type:complete len:198 (+),score=26.98 TRINITY_DN5247_c0_g2_i1:28-621(+)
MIPLVKQHYAMKFCLCGYIQGILSFDPENMSLQRITNQLIQNCSQQQFLLGVFRLQRLLGAQTQTNYYCTDFNDEIEKKKAINKLVYRSKQRGLLELDILMGNWVQQQIHQMDKQNLQQLDQVLNQENPDLWKWLTGQVVAPDEMEDNPVFRSMKLHVVQKLAENSTPQANAQKSQEWLKPWQEYNKQSSEDLKETS